MSTVPIIYFYIRKWFLTTLSVILHGKFEIQKYFSSDHISNLLIPLHFDERYHNGLQHYDVVTFEAIVRSFL